MTMSRPGAKRQRVWARVGPTSSGSAEPVTPDGERLVVMSQRFLDRGDQLCHVERRSDRGDPIRADGRCRTPLAGGVRQSGRFHVGYDGGWSSDRGHRVADSRPVECAFQEVDHNICPIDQSACSVFENVASAAPRTLTRTHRVSVAFDRCCDARPRRVRFTLEENPDPWIRLVAPRFLVGSALHGNTSHDATAHAKDALVGGTPTVVRRSGIGASRDLVSHRRSSQLRQMACSTPDFATSRT